MKNRSLIVVSRHWHAPQIEVKVDIESISISISIEDFVKAIAREIKHPMLIQTRASIEAAMVDAIAPVLEKVKDSSVHTP